MLDELAGFGSEYGPGLANHEPMVVGALELLGATPEQQRAFSTTFEAANPVEPFGPRVAPVGAWESCIGDRAREADLRDFFATEVGRLGIADAVARYLPRLAPGVCGSAFHPLMRLCYAQLRDDPAETARALAYWTATYLPMPDAAGVTPRTASPAEVLALVAEEPSLRALEIQYLLWHNIRQMGQAPAFAPVAGWLALDDTTIGRMAADALALYAATGDFCALHAVTGTHWIRIVTAERPAVRPALLRAFWQGVAGLMGEMGWPVPPSAEDTEARRRTSDLPNWEEIRAAARGATDEHDISVTYSAWSEAREYGDDDLYRFAAAARLGLVDPRWPTPWYLPDAAGEGSDGQGAP
jgi:hypothetical protein